MRKSELLAGLVLIAGAIWAVTVTAGLAFGKLQHVFSGLNPHTQTTVGMSGVVALLCSVVVAVVVRAAGRRAAKQPRQSERARIYQVALEALADRAGEATTIGSPLSRTLFLMASARVVKEYRALLQLRSAGDATEDQMRKQVNRLMLAMRRDVGQSTLLLENDDWADWLLGEVTEPPSEVQRASSQAASAGLAAAAPAHRL